MIDQGTDNLCVQMTKQLNISTESDYRLTESTQKIIDLLGTNMDHSNFVVYSSKTVHFLE